MQQADGSWHKQHSVPIQGRDIKSLPWCSDGLVPAGAETALSSSASSFGLRCLSTNTFFRRLKYFCYRKCLNLVVIWALQKLVDILYCFVFKRDLKKVKEELNWRVFFYAWRPFHEFIYPFMHHCNFFWFKTLSHCNFIFQLNEQINRIHYWLKTVNLSLNRSDIRRCSLRTLENKCKGYHK